MTDTGTNTARPRRASRASPGARCGRRSTTIDIHSHVAVPARGRRSCKPHLDLATVPLGAFRDAERKALNAKQEADRRTRMTGSTTASTSASRDMDDMGLDMQLVMPPPPQCYYTVPVEIAVKATRVVNDGIAEYVARKPDRFVALGTVPMQDGNEAAEELERSHEAARLQGRARSSPTSPASELSDPAFAPFWAKAEELGALVVIHPNGFTERRALLALLLQQRHRQSARYHDRAALPDLRRRAGAASRT